jgi:cephalosporin hydroxylase
VRPSVRARITYVAAPGASDPRPVELLYIDSSHGREETVAELTAWLPVLPAGALVVLDDYTHPEFPGVREATDSIGLAGELDGPLFVHRVGAGRAGT